MCGSSVGPWFWNWSPARSSCFISWPLKLDQLLGSWELSSLPPQGTWRLYPRTSLIKVRLRLRCQVCRIVCQTAVTCVNEEGPGGPSCVSVIRRAFCEMNKYSWESESLFFTNSDENWSNGSWTIYCAELSHGIDLLWVLTEAAAQHLLLWAAFFRWLFSFLRKM